MVNNLLFVRLQNALENKCVVTVASKRQSSANSGAWLRRFDDVTGIVKTDIFR